MTRPRATTSPSDALGATIADLKARLARLENIAHQHNTPATEYRIINGSNANGVFIRFADGTQICQHNVSITPVANTPTSTTWTFPASFAGVGGDVAVFATAESIVPGSIVVEVSASGISTTSANVFMFRTDTTTTTVRCMAIGRWF